MEKTNTPNYNTKYSRISDFHNFDAETEKEELKKLKRSALKNPDDAYNLATNPILKFNPITKKMDTMSKQTIEDDIESIEEYEEKTDEMKVIHFDKFDEGRMAFGEVSIDEFINKFNMYINDLRADIKILINKRIPKNVTAFNKLDEINRILEELVAKITFNLKTNKKEYVSEELGHIGHSGLDSHNPNSPFTKNYGEHFPIEEVPVDSEIVYRGATYYVIENTGVTIDISPELKGISKYKLNQEQFNDFCCIRKSDAKNIINKGVDVSNFGDPSEWQTDVRKDRKID